MIETWRYNAKLISKYDPKFRDVNGQYTKKDWVSFSQIGKEINGEKLTFQSYLDVENKYIKAANLFLSAHKCERIQIKRVEKPVTFEYNFKDREILKKTFEQIADGDVLDIANLNNILKLILRELLWSEIYCYDNQSAVIRFGYDYYMYFNSDSDLEDVSKQITALGLFVE